MTDLWLACCVVKMRENSLSGGVNLFKGVNVIDIRGLEIFAGVNLSHGSQVIEFELSRVSKNRGFEKSGVKL